MVEAKVRNLDGACAEDLVGSIPTRWTCRGCRCLSLLLKLISAACAGVEGKIGGAATPPRAQVASAMRVKSSEGASGSRVEKRGLRFSCGLLVVRTTRRTHRAKALRERHFLPSQSRSWRRATSQKRASKLCGSPRSPSMSIHFVNIKQSSRAKAEKTSAQLQRAASVLERVM
ncbi:unnamed protein product [Effrenium voratum]|uniref:Uncharacterized protein n=1 Tax=Effrenium voratum TaxID=2562239 RepID=A0AA36JD74_9DINO|nr:unnamed protein product [Effrenium voratum]